MVQTRFFPDHHWFSAAELDQIWRLAERERATVITTEKDQVRLPDRAPVWVTRQSVEVVEGREHLAKVLGLPPA